MKDFATVAWSLDSKQKLDIETEIRAKKTMQGIYVK